MQKDKTRLNSIRVTTAGISGGGNSHRISYLDVVKGALIILLVFAHFRSALNRTDFKNDYFEYVYGWNSIFTCFYMPAFFLISGYCSNFRKDPKTFLKSLLKSLVLPLFALSLVNDTMYALMVTHQDISTTLLKTIKSGGTLWFIQALVIAKVICYSIQKVTDALIIMLIATFVLLMAGVALNQFNLGSNPFYYQHGLVASFFVALGLFLKENQSIYEKALKYCLYSYPLLALINFWRSPNITASLSVSLKTIPLFLILSVCGTLFLIVICKKIKKCSFLEFWGQNSLVVYALHFAPLVYFFKLFYAWIQPISILSFVGALLLLLTTEYMLCCLLMKLFQYKPFKWLLGRY